MPAYPACGRQAQAGGGGIGGGAGAEMESVVAGGDEAAESLE